MDDQSRLIVNCNIGPGVTISPWTNLYGCTISEGVFIGPFVEIQAGVEIRAYTRIQSHTFIPAGVCIGMHSFIAHGVMFINDLFDKPLPRWIPRQTKVGMFVRIGSNATILPVNIGDFAIIGAGAVVTRDVPLRSVVAGNPARVIRKLTREEVDDILSESMGVAWSTSQL